VTTNIEVPGSANDESTVLFTLDEQLCGLPVGHVRDILDRFELSAVPMAPREVAGNLNLRGRIVTAIDLRTRLSIDTGDAANADARPGTAIVVEHASTLYALLVDQVSEVANLPTSCRQTKPIGLPRVWAGFTSCVYKLDKGLLALLDLEPLLALSANVH
jgi:purine-binding chemotaxis protein CheW